MTPGAPVTEPVVLPDDMTADAYAEYIDTLRAFNRAAAITRRRNATSARARRACDLAAASKWGHRS